MTVQVNIPGKDPNDPQNPEELQKAQDAQNEQAKENAKSGVPQPLVETKIAPANAQHDATEYVGEDGETVPVAESPVGQRSITAEDVAMEQPAYPYGTFQVGDATYSASTAPNNGSMEISEVDVPDDQKKLFHSIPGTPKGHVALTAEGEKQMRSAGFIEGDEAGQSNGIPFFRLAEKFWDKISGRQPNPHYNPDGSSKSDDDSKDDPKDDSKSKDDPKLGPASLKADPATGKKGASAEGKAKT